MRIVGITGTLGAGKGTACDYLVQRHGFAHYSARSVLMEMLEAQGLPADRDAMRVIANGLRQERGPAALAEVLLEKAIAGGRDALIESIRTEGEVVALRRKSASFALLAVDAGQRTRYERAVGRGSTTDAVSFETFAAQEMTEMHSTQPHEQNLARCMELADARVTNDGAVEELHEAVERFLARMGGGP